MTYREAGKTDIDTLMKLRFAYLLADKGALTEEETAQIKAQLIPYFTKQLGNSFFAFFAEEDNVPVAAAYLVISERPANPNFITGKIGTVVNVYTAPAYRKCGAATQLLTLLIEKGKELQVSKLELEATAMGKSVYEKLGFSEQQSSYTHMSLRFPK